MAEKRAEAKAANEVEMARMKLNNHQKKSAVKAYDVKLFLSIIRLLCPLLHKMMSSQKDVISIEDLRLVTLSIPM